MSLGRKFVTTQGSNESLVQELFVFNTVDVFQYNAQLYERRDIWNSMRSV